LAGKEYQSKRIKRMQITLNTFATLKDVIGQKEITLELAPKANLTDLFEYLEKKYGDDFNRQVKDQLTKELVPFLILVNDKTYRSIADMDKPISDGDVVTIMIPFDGG